MTGSWHKSCCARMCKVGQRALKSQHTEHASTLSSAALQEYWKVVASLSDDYNSWSPQDSVMHVSASLQK
jgi:hypothetical protein